MNRGRIALFLHLDLLTWETGRWSSSWNPFLEQSRCRPYQFPVRRFVMYHLSLRPEHSPQ